MIVSVRGVEMTTSPPGRQGALGHAHPYRIGMRAVRTKHQLVNVSAPVTGAQSGA